MDLAEAVEFDWAAAQANILSVRPGMPVLRVSSKKGTGMDAWIHLLKTAHANNRN
jgi:hydrogenase nickel incorporation protein HypB